MWCIGSGERPATFSPLNRETTDLPPNRVTRTNKWPQRAQCDSHISRVPALQSDIFLRFCGESHLWLPRRILHVKWEVDQVTSQQRFFITALIMAILFNFLSVVEPDHWTHFNLKFSTKSVDQFYRSGDSKMWWTALTLLMIATMATRFYSLGHPTSVW